MPSLAAMYCNSMAIKLDIKITDISKYEKFCPPVMEVDQLPGSMYPTATKAPGPEYINNVFQNPLPLGTLIVPLISSSERPFAYWIK